MVNNGFTYHTVKKISWQDRYILSAQIANQKKKDSLHLVRSRIQPYDNYAGVNDFFPPHPTPPNASAPGSRALRGNFNFTLAHNFSISFLSSLFGHKMFGLYSSTSEATEKVKIHQRSAAVCEMKLLSCTKWHHVSNRWQNEWFLT